MIFMLQPYTSTLKNSNRHKTYNCQTESNQQQVTIAKYVLLFLCWNSKQFQFKVCVASDAV